MTPISDARGGAALLAALWLTTVLSGVGLAVAGVGRSAVVGAAYRADVIRASWILEACIATARASVDELLSSPSAPQGEIWHRLDRSRALVQIEALGCAGSLDPVGTKIDVNLADSGQLAAGLVVAGTPAPRADSMVAALLDWRDPDGVSRKGGAEESWYTDRRRPPPGDGPLSSVAELGLVRGFETGAFPFLGTDEGRVVLSHAPASVLASLPGFDSEVLAAVLRLRADSSPVDFDVIESALSQTAAARFRPFLPQIIAASRPYPEDWWLRLRVRDLQPGRAVVRLGRRGDRVTIVDRTVNPW